MGFNNQAKNFAGDHGTRKFIFKEGVQYKQMTGKQPILFRLLPAFDPNNQNPGTSYLPFVDPAGNLSDWGAFIKMVRFVGHGKAGMGRQDLLSLKTFEEPGRPIRCPLETLHAAIQSDAQTWGYLLEDQGDKNDRNRPRAAFNRISNHLIANVLDLNQVQKGTQIGVFSSTLAAKLVDQKDGLAFQPNGSPDVEESIKRNYLFAYANGDITCPNYAPVMEIVKGVDKGEMSGYKMSIVVVQNRVMRRPLDQDMMAHRYHMTDLSSFINIPTEEELVQSLIQLLNGRSPAFGYHEHALLKIAFPEFQIPEPPAAPAGSPTIAAGFGPSPAAGIPGMVPNNNMVPPASITTPPAVVPQSSGIPGMVPMSPVQPIPGNTPVQTVSVPVTGGTVPTVTGTSAPNYNPTTTTADPTPVQPSSTLGSTPIAPGDKVEFDQVAFLKKLRGEAK